MNDEILIREPDILEMNKNQIKNHIGNDGNELINSNYKFPGIYSRATEIISNGKKKQGMLYDFNNTGLFLKSFDLRNDLSIFSYGVGNGLKKAFFDGYSNMFGLTNENETKLLEEVKNYILETTLNNLWE